MTRVHRFFLGISAAFAVLAIIPAGLRAQVGVFDSHGDVGLVLHPGSTDFDAAKKIYTLTGSGDNMWAAEDDFQFVWKKITGDVTLSADVSIVTPTGDPHRKAALMIRRTLDKDSDYVDAVVHGSGMTALQSREQKGAPSEEIISIFTGPKRLSLVKRGNYVYMMISGQTVGGVEKMSLSGGSMKLSLNEPFYVGLAVCAHNKEATVQATFSNVELVTEVPAAKPVIYSTLERIPVASPERAVVHVTQGRMEGPMWMKDGKSLVYTNGGKLESIAIADHPMKPTVILTGALSRIGHHTAISPDGSLLGFTDETGGKTAIYTVPVEGGTPKLITDNGSSYFQGWSPDGKIILYCGTRNGKTQILTMPAGGGAETMLGTANNNNDSPEYSPDGKYLYFNSDRTGLMQIWRMTAEGKEETQITTDEFSNWFPHVSPDGINVAYMSYDNGVAGHPNDADIHIRSMVLSTKIVKAMANFMGSPGSFHSAAWSPDSKSLALVSYQAVQ